MKQDPFKEYIKEAEPDKRKKGYAWHTAIGLQAVDGLKASEYLVNIATRNIEGEISFGEANALLETYYEENPAQDSDRTELSLCFLRKRSASPQTSISRSIESCFLVSTLTPVKFAITTSQRKNGFSTERV